MFREQAVEAQRESVYGKTIQITPLKYMHFTAMIIAVFSLLVLLIILAPYSKKANVQGHLVPVDGITEIRAPNSTRVRDVYVTEGQSVTKGQPLLQLTTPLSTGDDFYEVSYKELQNQLYWMKSRLVLEDNKFKQRKEELKTTLDIYRQQLALVKEQENTLKQQLKTCNKLLRSMEKLLSTQVISEKEYLLETSRCLEIQRDSTANSQAMLEITQTLNKFEVELNTSDRVLAEILLNTQNEISAQKQLILKHEIDFRASISAPTDGKIVSLNVKNGDFMKSEELLIIMAPNNYALEAELFVPSRSIAALAKGQTVRLKYDSYPYQRFGWGSGEINSISETMISAQDIPIPVDSSQRFYRIVVALKHQHVNEQHPSRKLVNGMIVNADIAYDTRYLWQWMFNFK